MKGISDRMAEVIVRQSGREEKYIEVISYGFQAVLGTAAEFLAIILIGFILGMFKEMLLLAAVFAVMRVMAGGVHFSTYPRCFISSAILFTFGGYTARFFNGLSSDIGVAYLTTATCFVIYSLWRYSPRDNPNRLIKEEELPRFRKMSFLLAGVIFLFLLLAYYMNGKTGWYHYSIVTGLLLEGISLTDNGYRFIKFIEDKLEKRGGVMNEKS